jgi:Cys-Gly metallodipeptidase DUG1
MPAPPELLSYIDASARAFIAWLSEGVAIPSISGNPPSAPTSSPCPTGSAHNSSTVKQVDLGTHLMDGVTLPLCPAILGRIGEDLAKKTVLVYGHFDVRPAAKSDGTPSRSSTWRCGARGPVLGWLGVLQWHYEH